MKLIFSIVLAFAVSAEAFTVPQQCGAPYASPSRIFYKNDEEPILPENGSTTSDLNKIARPPSSGDIESIEDEPMTKEDVDRIRNIVKDLCSVETQTLDDIVVNNRDLDKDMEAISTVVTPLSDSLAKIGLKALRHADAARKDTESIFEKLADLLDDADQLFPGVGERLEYEKYPNHPEV